MSSPIAAPTKAGKLFLALVGALTLGGAASAAVTDLNPYSRGCADTSGGHFCGSSGAATRNHFTGSDGSTKALRGFYLFDLSGVSGTIISVTLAFEMDSTVGVVGPNGSEDPRFP